MRCLPFLFLLVLSSPCQSGDPKAPLPLLPWKTAWNGKGDIRSFKPANEYFSSLDGKIVRFEGVTTGGPFGTAIDPDDGITFHWVAQGYLAHRKGTDFPPHVVSFNVRVRFADRTKNRERLEQEHIIVGEGKFSLKKDGTKLIDDVKLISFVRGKGMFYSIDEWADKRGVKLEY